jgi:hypothetical protein
METRTLCGRVGAAGRLSAPDLGRFFVQRALKKNLVPSWKRLLHSDPSAAIADE